MNGSIDLIENPPTPCRIGKRPPAREDRPAIEGPRGGVHHTPASRNVFPGFRWVRLRPK